MFPPCDALVQQLLRYLPDGDAFRFCEEPDLRSCELSDMQGRKGYLLLGKQQRQHYGSPPIILYRQDAASPPPGRQHYIPIITTFWPYRTVSAGTSLQKVDAIHSRTIATLVCHLHIDGRKREEVSQWHSKAMP